METLDQFIASRTQSDHALAVIMLLLIAFLAALWRVWRYRFVQKGAGVLVDLAAIGSAIVAFPASPIWLFVAWFCTPLRLPKSFQSKISLWKPHISLIMMFGGLLRLPMLYDSLWYDEAFTYSMASLPLDQFFQALMADVHPPLYYLLKWGWFNLTGGWGEAVFRFPDLLCGLATIYLIYRLARAVAGEGVGLTAALLTAVTPSAIYYSSEARGYALLSLAALWALLIIVEWRYTGRAWLVLLVGLMVGSHHLGWAYAGVLLLLAFWRGSRSKEHRPAWLFLFAGMVFASPNLLLALSQSGSMTDGYWLTFNLAQPLWLLPFNLRTVDNALLIPAVFPYLLVVIASVWAARGMIRNTSGLIVGGFTLGVPMLVLLASVVWQPLFLHRALLPIALLINIPIAIALNSGVGRWLRPLVASVMFISLIALYRDAGVNRPDYARVLQACGNADAPIFATSIQAAFIARANTYAPITIWRGAVDNGETMHIGQMESFGFRVGDYQRGITCLLFEESPRTAATERSYIQMLRVRTLNEFVLYPHKNRRVSVYLVEL